MQNVDLSWMDGVWMKKRKGLMSEVRSVELIARHAGRGFARSTSAARAAKLVMRRLRAPDATHT